MFKDENTFNGTTVTHLQSYMLLELEWGCQEFVHTVYSLWATAWDSLGVRDNGIKSQSFPPVSGGPTCTHRANTISGRPTFADLGPFSTHVFLAGAHSQLWWPWCPPIHPQPFILSYRTYIMGPNLTLGQGNVLHSRAAPSHMRLVALCNLSLLFICELYAQLLQGTVLYFSQTVAPVVSNLK